MKLCVTSKIARALPFNEAVRLAKEVGYEEFDFGFSYQMLIKDGWEAEIKSSIETMRDAGMRVKYAHLPYDYPGNESEWPAFFTATQRAVDAAVLMGAECAAIHPRCSMREDYDEDVEYANALEFLKPYCEYAHKKGLPLGIENMRGKGASAPARIRRFAMRTDEVISLAKELDEGVCWDTGHGNISLQNEYKSIKKIGSLLREVHINDNFAEDDIHIAPFLGKVDWTGVLKGLKEVDYKGSLNMEVTCGKLPANLIEPYAKYMAASGKELIRLFEEI